MKKIFIFKILIVSAIGTILLFNASNILANSDFKKLESLKILEGEWNKYKSNKPNFDGGLAMQVSSPEGAYFISTGMPKDINNKYHFRIASCTKTFTAAAILLLNQQKKLNLDDKITDNIPGTDMPYVPNIPEYNIPYKDKITIRMLLMHRAGVFDVANNIIPDNKDSHNEPYAKNNYIEYILNKDKTHTFTFDELIGIVAKNHLSFFQPGKSYHYSNTGYSILGKIIERVSGKPYSAFITKKLFIPNDLLDTSSPWTGSDRKLPKPFVDGYVWKDGMKEKVTISNISPQVAEGNIISTPIDLTNWCRKLLKGEAGLTKESIKAMKLGMSKGDGKLNELYGLGLASSLKNGYYGHSGAHEGYLTLMFYNPKTDISYVIFTNMWNVQKGLDSIEDELSSMMKIATKIVTNSHL